LKEVFPQFSAVGVGVVVAGPELIIVIPRRQAASRRDYTTLLWVSPES
jgi:hypothetical protein